MGGDLYFENAFDVLAASLASIQEQLDEIKTQQVEIIEKLNNLSLDSDGFEVYDELT